VRLRWWYAVEGGGVGKRRIQSHKYGTIAADEVDLMWPLHGRGFYHVCSG
jgi:hypothetical protein